MTRWVLSSDAHEGLTRKDGMQKGGDEMGINMDVRVCKRGRAQIDAGVRTEMTDQGRVRQSHNYLLIARATG